jgi:hypothetical protein
MISPRRRQLALPLESLQQQRPRFPDEVVKRIREAMADLLLQVSRADLDADVQAEEVDDESAR